MRISTRNFAKIRVVFRIVSLLFYMTLKNRRILFYSFIFLFIIAGLGVVSYSQGWRIVTENCKIVKLLNCSIKFQKTGAIFIEARPKGVLIKIDGKVFKDKSGLIQSGTLITNLSPKTYRLKVEKDGYLAWTKNAVVKSGLVTETLKIILIPEKIEKKPIAVSKTIDNFWLSSQQKIVFKNKENLYFFQESLASPTKLKGDEFIQWSEDNNKIIVQDSKNQIYYLYELNNLSKALNINATLNNLQKMNITEIAFHPLESSRLIIKDKKGFLYLLDTNRLKLETIVKEPVLSWTIKSPNIYYIKKTKSASNQRESAYVLASFSLTVKTENFAVELSSPVNSTQLSYGASQLINQEPSEINAFGNKIAFLTKDGGLYLFDQMSRNFNQIAHSAEKFVFSPDNKKIAFLDRNGKLNIYFLEDYQRGIQKKAGEVISLNFYEGFAVKNIFWYKDSHHLLVEYIGSAGSAYADFIEIDDRLPINKYTLFEEVFNFHYESGLDRFYFIQENGLRFAEF